MKPLWIAAAAALLVSPASAMLFALPGAAQTIPIADRSIDPRDARALRINFWAGELHVIATDVRDIHLRLTGRCEGAWDDCRERAGQIEVVSQYTGDAVWLRLTGTHKFNPRGPKLILRIEVPRTLAVGIDMSAGDLTVHGVERDLNVDMSAGDINIDLPERRVRSVVMHVSVGDATLRHHGRVHGGEGWLGKRIDWDEGNGASRVRVKLTAGDANVLLR